MATPDELVVTPTTRDAAERALAALTQLTHHGGQTLGNYERFTLVNRVVANAARYGHKPEQRDRLITGLTADALLDKLAGLDQTDTGTLAQVADVTIRAILRAQS